MERGKMIILLFLLLALICFIVAIVPSNFTRINWVPLGLAFWVLTAIIPRLH